MSPFICCGKGRVGGRTAIFSSLSRTISRDNEHFSRLLMVELNRTRNVSPLPIFRPGGLFIIVMKLCVRNCIIYFLFSFYHFCFEFDMYFYCIKHNSFVFSETLINVIYTSFYIIFVFCKHGKVTDIVCVI